MRPIDITGVRFGRLTAIARLPESNKTNHPLWQCRCDCGADIKATAGHLRSGNRTSCGCRRRTHNMCKTPIYKVWASMLARCRSDHPRYGGRGIKVCERWEAFEAFYEDMGSTYRHGLEIDRTNNEAGYSPENCKWVTVLENNRNKCTTIFIWFDGKNRLVSEIAKLTGVPADTIFRRHKAGKTEETGLGIRPSKPWERFRFPAEVVALVLASVGSSEKVGAEFGMSASQVRNIRRGLQRQATAMTGPTMPKQEQMNLDATP